MINTSDYINYVSATEVYYNFIHHLFTKKENALYQSIYDNNNIEYIKATLIILFLGNKKEQIVSKEENLNCSLKVYDEQLKLQLEEILKNVKIDKLGNYSFINSATLLSYLRNKACHGDYKIDASNSIITFGEDIKFKINDLYGIIYGSTVDLIMHPKRKEYNRDFIEHSIESVPQIKNRKDLKAALKAVRIKRYSMKSINENDIPLEACKEFDNLFKSHNSICKTINITNNSKLLNLFKLEFQNAKELFLEKYKVILNQEELILDSCKYNALLDALDEDKKIYDVSIIEQQKYIDNLALEIMDNNKIADKKMFSIVSHLDILLHLESKDNQYDDNLIFRCAQEMVLSSLIMRFLSSYCYPYDSMLKPKNTEIKFNFGKLDLSFTNPTIIDCEDDILKKLKLENDNCRNQFLQAYERFLEIGDSLEKCYIKGNNKGVEALSKKAKAANNLLDSKLDKSDEARNKLKKYDDFLKAYPNYYKNYKIIDGLRNSIAHNNYSISKQYGYNLMNFDINFKDYDSFGKLVFDLTISSDDFCKLFNIENIEALVSMFNANIKVISTEKIKTKKKD